ncbi:hypothetical protein BASA62_008381 [Batrachochytrium salamandrivorans]|nr:hypothetical protein BASA62_008381 [Batrachochytrium salamandrivorans]
MPLSSADCTRARRRSWIFCYVTCLQLYVQNTSPFPGVDGAVARCLDPAAPLSRLTACYCSSGPYHQLFLCSLSSVVLSVTTVFYYILGFCSKLSRSDPVRTDSA